MIKYYLNNWKLIIHLLFRTYYFGVNNEWWCSFRSIFGLPIWKRGHLLKEFKLIRFRAQIGFIPTDMFRELFPKYSKRQRY